MHARHLELSKFPPGLLPGSFQTLNIQASPYFFSRCKIFPLCCLEKWPQTVGFASDLAHEGTIQPGLVVRVGMHLLYSHDRILGTQSHSEVNLAHFTEEG